MCFTGHGSLLDRLLWKALWTILFIFSCDVVLPTLQLVSKYSKFVAEQNFLVSFENTPEYV